MWINTLFFPLDSDLKIAKFASRLIKWIFTDLTEVSDISE